ncbi:hypothetical protein ACO0LO_08605 [Undibacterium sp. TJN25]|uniref:hypothetical protein n=1 Tax=Undibacterium sp. TJN25 TaxID=3413056 RepID=UPI003BEFEE6F
MRCKPYVCLYPVFLLLGACAGMDEPGKNAGSRSEAAQVEALENGAKADSSHVRHVRYPTSTNRQQADSQNQLDRLDNR